MEIKLFFHSNPWRSTFGLRFDFWWVKCLSVHRAFPKLQHKRKAPPGEEEEPNWGPGNCPQKNQCRKKTLFSKKSLRIRNTGLTALETELLKSSLSTTVSETFLTLISTWAPSLVRGSKGGLHVGLSVQSLGCHPRPTAGMPVGVAVCLMWCTFSAAPNLSVLSFFSSVPGNSKGFLKILQKHNQKHSINQQHSSRSTFCPLVATHMASVSNGSWLLRSCFSAYLVELSYVVSWPLRSRGTDEQNQLNTEFSADRNTNSSVWHGT